MKKGEHSVYVSELVWTVKEYHQLTVDVNHPILCPNILDVFFPSNSVISAGVYTLSCCSRLWIYFAESAEQDQTAQFLTTKPHTPPFNPLPNDKILDKSKFKAFADDKIKVT